MLAYSIAAIPAGYRLAVLDPLDERLKDSACWAGRWADAGGRWTVPCWRTPRHQLGFGDAEHGQEADIIMVFCDEHIEQLIAWGLIEEPNLDPDEWQRRLR